MHAAMERGDHSMRWSGEVVIITSMAIVVGMTPVCRNDIID